MFTSSDIPRAIKCSGTLLPCKQSVNIYFLLFRIILTLYTIGILLWSLISYIFTYNSSIGWFFYVTNWTTICVIGYFCCICILHFQVYTSQSHGNYINNELQVNPHLYRLSMFFLSVGIAWSICLVIVYWGFTYDGNFSILSLHEHGIIALLIVLEWFTNRLELPYLSCFLPSFIGVLWIVVSLILYFVEWRNDIDNGRYIYPRINWGKNAAMASGFCILFVVIFMIIHCLFTFVKNKLIDYESRLNAVETYINTKETKGSDEESPLIAV